MTINLLTVGRSIRYHPDDIKAYMDQNRIIPHNEN
jgi:hypothetical protein